MPYCRKCGSQLDDQALFCTKCGTPVSQQRTQPAYARSRPFPTVLVVLIVVGVVVLGLVLIPIFLGQWSPWSPFGTIAGSGNVVTQNQGFTDFSAVRVSNGFEFSIVQSDFYRVQTITDDNLQSYVQVSKTGNTLSIGLKPGYSITTTTLRVEINMPSLGSIEISGGTRGSAEGFISTLNFNADASGGSRLQMQGRANEVTATASGGSQLDLSEFAVTNASVNLSGGSQAQINADGRINGEASGGSRLFYSDNPDTSGVNVSGGSTIERR